MSSSHASSCGARRLATIEIADQTNAERYVVQIIAVHVPAVDLAAPAIAHFNLAVSVEVPFPITK
mgnify:CR=1 FL=1